MKKKGVFLLFALWLFVLLSLFCLGLGMRTFIGTRKTKLFLNKTRAFYLSVSGIKIAREVLREDDVTVDNLQEEWAKLIEEEINFSSPSKKGKITITIEDESGRLNINKTEDKILKKLFESKSIENAQEKIEYVLDYIDEDRNPRGIGSKSEEKTKNEALSVTEELLLIPAISRDDYDNIKDYITVIGSDKMVNINTADKELLEFLIESPIVREQVLRLRFGPNLVSGGNDDGNFTDATLPVELKNIFKTKSSNFRITSSAEVDDVKKKIVCIIDRGENRILYWYEK